MVLTEARGRSASCGDLGSNHDYPPPPGHWPPNQQTLHLTHFSSPSSSMTVQETLVQDFPTPTNNSGDPLIVLLPLLIVLSTLLFLLLLFLICILLLRKRRSIVLRDSDGPIDLSREEYLESDGGFEIIETRWLESVSELERTTYRRAQSTPLISLH